MSKLTLLKNFWGSWFWACFDEIQKKEEFMNVFIILSILIIVIGVLLLVATPSVLFKLNWKEKTGKEKILMFMFYSILVYIINIIYWIIK